MTAKRCGGSQARKIVTLHDDWTNKDARIPAELAVYNRSAVLDALKKG